MSEKELSLGEYLRQERELRCITIEQVASATKVGVKTLHSLEEGHFSELPAKPFIRGFVTSYCRFIGLDAKEVLARFENYIDLKSSERPNREAGHSGYAFEKKDGEQQGRMILLIAIVSSIVIGGLAMLFLKPSLRHHRSSHIDRLREAHVSQEPVAVATHPPSGGSPILSTVSPPNAPQSSSVASLLPAVQPSIPPVLLTPNPVASGTPESVASAPASVKPIPLPTPLPSESPSPSPSPSTLSAGANPDDPLDSGHSLPLVDVHHRAIFKVLEDVWVRFQVDGRPVRKFIIRKGRSLVLRGKDGIRFQVSNPKSIVMSYNGGGFISLNHLKKPLQIQAGSLFLPSPPPEVQEGEEWGDGRSLPKTPDPAPDGGDASNLENPSP